MTEYFFWFGVVFHCVSAIGVTLVLVCLFVEWYLDAFKMKWEFLLWYREKLAAKKERRGA